MEEIKKGDLFIVPAWIANMHGSRFCIALENAPQTYNDRWKKTTSVVSMYFLGCSNTTIFRHWLYDRVDYDE